MLKSWIYDAFSSICLSKNSNSFSFWFNCMISDLYSVSSSWYFLLTYVVYFSYESRIFLFELSYISRSYALRSRFARIIVYRRSFYSMLFVCIKLECCDSLSCSSFSLSFLIYFLNLTSSASFSIMDSVRTKSFSLKKEFSSLSLRSLSSSFSIIDCLSLFSSCYMSSIGWPEKNWSSLLLR